LPSGPVLRALRATLVHMATLALRVLQELPQELVLKALLVLRAPQVPRVVKATQALRVLRATLESKALRALRVMQVLRALRVYKAIQELRV
jgi:hypothetical protein